MNNQSRLGSGTIVTGAFVLNQNEYLGTRITKINKIYHKHGILILCHSGKKSEIFIWKRLCSSRVGVHLTPSQESEVTRGRRVLCHQQWGVKKQSGYSNFPQTGARRSTRGIGKEVTGLNKSVVRLCRLLDYYYIYITIVTTITIITIITSITLLVRLPVSHFRSRSAAFLGRLPVALGPLGAEGPPGATPGIHRRVATGRGRRQREHRKVRPRLQKPKHIGSIFDFNFVFNLPFLGVVLEMSKSIPYNKQRSSATHIPDRFYGPENWLGIPLDACAGQSLWKSVDFSTFTKIATIETTAYYKNLVGQKPFLADQKRVLTQKYFLFLRTSKLQ